MFARPGSAALNRVDACAGPICLECSACPKKAYGFVGVVTSLKDLSSSIWAWYRADADGWAVKKVIEIPAEPASAEELPPLLKGFNAVPPLVTDINLSLDDRFLYVSCWGTGELRQYDASDPFAPRLTGSVRIGGIVRRAAHPSFASQPPNGGPQMVEISRDGRRGEACASASSGSRSGRSSSPPHTAQG